MSTVTFEYSRPVTMPRRLAGAVGQRRQLPARDAQRLAADGVGQIVIHDEAPPPTAAASSDTHDESRTTDDES